MNESDIIKYILNNDISSPQKKKMQEGERYYNGEQDILQKDFRQGRILETEETGEEHSRVFQNYNRSNHKNVNAFLKILVDQKTAYLVSREPTISVIGAEQNKDLKDYETILCDFADDTFNEVLQDFVTGASNKGFESIHVYYDEKGQLQYQVVPANEVIPIYDTENEKELLEVIRYYDITVVKDGQQYTRKKVEWWTKTNVTYYIEQQKDMYVKDTSIPFHLKVNTGMNRLGLSIEDFKKAFFLCHHHPQYCLKGIMTHFATADENHKQYQVFKEALQGLDCSSLMIHCFSSNSLQQDDLTNYCRVGVRLYGLFKRDLMLKNALEIESPIAHIQKVYPHDFVGYDFQYEVKEKGYVYILPLGYANGWGRFVKSYAFFENIYLEQAGTISMDYTAYFSTQKIKKDTILELVSLHVPIEQLADYNRISIYEILTRLRLKRIYL